MEEEEEDNHLLLSIVSSYSNVTIHMKILNTYNMSKNFAKWDLVQTLLLVEDVDVVVDDSDDEACLDGQDAHKVQDRSHFTFDLDIS